MVYYFVVLFFLLLLLLFIFVLLCYTYVVVWNAMTDDDSYEQKSTWLCFCYIFSFILFSSFFLILFSFSWICAVVSVITHIVDSFKHVKHMLTATVRTFLFTSCCDSVSLLRNHCALCVKMRWKYKQTCLSGGKKTTECTNSRP